MANEQAETSGKPPETAANTSAPQKVELTQEELEQLKVKAYREAQSAQGKEAARLRQALAEKERELAQRQQLERDLREQAANRLRKAGDDDADEFGKDVELLHKARQYDAIKQQQEATAQWATTIQQVAEAHGLKPEDERLNAWGVQNLNELIDNARKAMREDAEAERKRLREDAGRERQAATDKVVQSGSLDTLGGSPAGRPDLRSQYEAELKRIPRGQVLAITNLQRKYRKLGLEI